MELLCLTFFIISFVSVNCLTVNKCCPYGQILNKKFGCFIPERNGTSIVGFSATLAPNEDLSWFPHFALYNATTQLKLPKDEQEVVKGWLTTKWKVSSSSDFIPNCGSFRQFSHINATKEFFRILVHNESYADVLTIVSDMIDEEDMHDEVWRLPLEDVCLDISYKPAYMLVYCPHPRSSKPWVRKCCPLGQFYNTQPPARCTKFPDQFKMTNWRPHNSPSGEVNKYFLHYTKRVGYSNRPDCGKNKTLKLLRDSHWEIRCRGFLSSKSLFDYEFLPNGSITFSNETYSVHQYCGERSWHPAGVFLERNLFYCGEKAEEKSNISSSVKTLYGVLFLLGGFCLLLTVVISLLLPELRQRIHNQIAITHNATLMTAHFLWGASLLVSSQNITVPMCIVLCLLIQFTFLGSLFWLNAMCINMSSTFRTTRNIGNRSIRSDTRRYGIYSGYAWGFAAMISVITLIMELADTVPLGLPRPGFSCFCDFSRSTFSVFVYFYGPMAVLLISNSVLYIFTVWKIMSVSEQVTSVLKQKDSKTSGHSSIQSDKQRLILYTKLFCIMGLTWLTEIIGWAVDHEMKAYVFWTMLDVINLLRAVFIFVIFICQKPVLRKLHCHFQNATGRLRTSATSNHTTATDAMSISMSGLSRQVSHHEETGRKRSRDLVDTACRRVNMEMEEIIALKCEKMASEFNEASAAEPLSEETQDLE